MDTLVGRNQRPSAISFVDSSQDNNRQQQSRGKSDSPISATAAPAPLSGFRRSSVASLHSEVSGSQLGVTPKNSSTVIPVNTVGVGVSTSKHFVGYGDREVVNGLSFPKSVAKKIPKYQRRNNSETYILQCFVDLYLDPEEPISLDGTVSQFRSDSGKPLAGPIAVNRKSTTKKSLTDEVIEVPMLATEPHSVRGPFPVRIPLNASAEEAASICRQTLAFLQEDDVTKHSQLLLQQQLYNEARERSSMLNSSLMNQSSKRRTMRRGTSVTGDVAAEANSLHQHGGGTTNGGPGAGEGVVVGTDGSLLLPVSDESLKPHALSLFDLNTILAQDNEDAGGLFLRRCDAFGRSTKGEAMFTRSNITLLSQLVPNINNLNCTLALHVVLAPDPSFFATKVREANLKRLEAEKSIISSLEEKRRKNTEAIEERRRQREMEGMVNSLDRDRELRKKMQIPSTSMEVKHWRRDTLLAIKKRDLEAQQQRKQEQSRLIEEFYTAQTKNAIDKEMTYLEEHHLGSQLLQEEETQERSSFLEEFRDKKRSIEIHQRAAQKLRHIGALVERNVGKQLQSTWSENGSKTDCSLLLQ